tara:strand:- start:1133 stop:2485 length:1353 start_codon:yes stop_codon:yes gene_type:complete
MIKKINKLVGLKKSEFDSYVDTGKISLSESRLIPVLKTGDEMALTSIIMSSLRLIKEFKDQFFKETKLKRGGKAYYYTEVCFKDIDKESRIDGLILIVVSGEIKDAAFLEVKNGKNVLSQEQMLKYYKLAQALQNVPKIITISNEFVGDSSQSPIYIKNQSKKISLFHFSWTYIKTLAQLLLFDNDDNIRDEDQVEIMKEVLFYLDDDRSGVSGFHRMSSGWKEVAEKIKNQQSLSDNDIITDAINSWYQEEADMSLLLSRKLGTLVKMNKENLSSRIEKDIKKLKKTHTLSSKYIVKGAVSDLKILADFDRRTVEMSVYVTAPLDRGIIARITWMKNQLKSISDATISDSLFVEADIKYTNNSIKYSLTNIDNFYEHEGIKEKDIIGFNIDFIQTGKFSQVSGFVNDIEDMLLNYYKQVVQNLRSWEKPAPKLQELKEPKEISKPPLEA